MLNLTSAFIQFFESLDAFCYKKAYLNQKIPKSELCAVLVVANSKT